MSTTPVEVLITVSFADNLLARLRTISPRLRFAVHPARKAEEIPVDVWKRAEVLYTSDVLPEPEKAPNLKWVQLHQAGVDDMNEHPLLNQEGVAVTTLSGAAAPQMAEFAVMLLLTLGHRLPAILQNQARADWPKDRWERFNPRELRKSTVGIVGYGSIGREVARLLQPFDVQILATKRDAMHPADNGYMPEGMGDPEGNLFSRLYPAEALRSMLKECDFVVVTAPLTADTHNLIGEEELRAMKNTAYLVDVSRGGVVNQRALLSALQENRLGGAALDVFPEEPLPANSPFWRLHNVIISPHIAWLTPHYNERAIDLFAVNLDHYLGGAPLLNRYESERGY